MKEDIPNEKLLSRLAKIEGQVRGVSKMLDDGRYCIDVVEQSCVHHESFSASAFLSRCAVESDRSLYSFFLHGITD